LHRNNEFKAAFCKSVSHRWKEDPETLSILKQRASSDENGPVRQAAVQTLQDLVLTALRAFVLLNNW
jgi:hypothetical protein